MAELARTLRNPRYRERCLSCLLRVHVVWLFCLAADSESLRREDFELSKQWHQWLFFRQFVVLGTS